MPARHYPPMGPQRYRIVVRGEFERLADAVEGWHVRASEGQTVIEGEARDQAQLHGVLTTLRSLGVDLVSVNPASPGAPPNGRDERATA